MRIVKNAVVRKNEILDVAEKLFCADGYDNTSTNDIQAANVDSKTGRMILEQVHKPQNALMHSKMQEKMLSNLVPLFVKIIEDGISEGLMNTDYPEETIQMLLLYANTFFDDSMDFSIDEKMRMIKGFICNAETLLHMKKGSMMDVMFPLFNK